MKTSGSNEHIKETKIAGSVFIKFYLQTLQYTDYKYNIAQNKSVYLAGPSMELGVNL